MANEIFNCEINALLDKFFDAPDKAALKAAQKQQEAEEKAKAEAEAEKAKEAAAAESDLPPLEEQKDEVRIIFIM